MEAGSPARPPGAIVVSANVQTTPVSTLGENSFLYLVIDVLVELRLCVSGGRQEGHGCIDVSAAARSVKGFGNDANV